jgi:DNA mismatch repair protein MutL
MNRIQVLPPQVVNQIAAGEVVERPASVVKELIENALDANATRIDVEIQDAGFQLIQVSDNGEGMSKDDALLSIHKHATSKIKNVEDLFTIQSFGFRGEALASIASVSDFTITTRKVDQEVGTYLKINLESVMETRDVARNPGTTVSISKLFSSTPARLKFMKKKTTEERHILTTILTYALAFPSVAFQIKVNSTIIFQMSHSTFNQRLEQVFGKNICENMLPFEAAYNLIGVKGVISIPTVTRSTRENMIYFVNNRWIMNSSLNYAVLTAYQTLLPTKRFPMVVLFLQIPPGQVDVNVHPTKREVKFTNEHEIYQMVVHVIREQLLKSNISNQPTLESNPMVNSFEKTHVEWGGDVNKSTEEKMVPQSTQDSISQFSNDLFKNSLTNLTMTTVLNDVKILKSSSAARKIDPNIVLYNFTQIFNTFIVFQSDTELFIADQHTVHERLNFEHWLKKLQNQQLEIQPLLIPEQLDLTLKESRFLIEHSAFLKELGMEITEFGRNTFLINSVPADFKDKNVKQLVKDFIDKLSQSETIEVKEKNRFEELRERAITFLSCRSAVMAGEHLNENQMKQLIDQMRRESIPFACPHGRPTIISISLSELYRRFDRH